MEIYFFAVNILIIFAVSDLVVGVSNDAVNFLNSAIGSRVSSRKVILILASLGIFTGVIFSSGMMEVARKGIFHPQFFTMPELLIIFLAVMFTDIILLDTFNTYGLPTSTTVSIVFELLGGAVAVSALKIIRMNHSLFDLTHYINSSRAMVIIFGILLSVVVAFICGAGAQFLSRLLFTFDYTKKIKRYGAVWGGIALAFITYFILIKGAKGASFITPETIDWIKHHTVTMLGAIFAVSAIILQILIFLKVNIFKPIVLIGTFALAMAFAANDLVNFIGVPVAGIHAYSLAASSGSPGTASMAPLAGKVATNPLILLLAGLVMVLTLWLSKKAKTVTETEISLGQQSEEEEEKEKFGSTGMARKIVKMTIGFFNFVRMIIPAPVRNWMMKRLDTSHYRVDTNAEGKPSFDLLRASVNMMVASAVISYATSNKLPLSTTYVTFMVAMGSSFADLAWGRETAVYRITGVLTVISGWFFTAFSAFLLSMVIATVIFYTKAAGVIVLLVIIAVHLFKNHIRHSEREKQKDKDQIFNLKKVTDVTSTIATTFEQMGLFIQEIKTSTNNSIDGLFLQNEYILRNELRKSKTIQRWANIIIANIFKAVRLFTDKDRVFSYKYGQTIRRLQKLADGQRDIAYRAYNHVSNHHKGLLQSQIEELKQVQDILNDILDHTIKSLMDNNIEKYKTIILKDSELRKLAADLNERQIERIRSKESKTRLTILYYAIIGNAMMISKQCIELMKIFSNSFGNK